MAKFCTNCGAKFDDDARVCGQCGTPLGGNQVKKPALKAVDPEKKKKIKKKVKMITSLLLVAAIATAAVTVALNFIGSKGLVRKVMKAYKDYDIDSMVELSSDMYYYGDESYVYEYFEDHVGSNMDYFESSVGHSYKMSYEIEEIYDLSKRKQNEIFENIEYIYPDFDVHTIEKIAIAQVNVMAKQGSKSEKIDVKITMSKEGNEWRILYLE